MWTTLYKNADWIITMNEKREKIRHGDLLISGNEIQDVRHPMIFGIQEYDIMVHGYLAEWHIARSLKSERGYWLAKMLNRVN